MEPSSLLGPTHPLTRALRDSRAVARQARAVAMLLAAALTAALNGLAWAWAGAIGAAVVLLGLGAVAVAVRTRANWAAREVIADGGERLPLAPIERERARLLDEGTRSNLAASLERMLDQSTTTTRRNSPALRPLFDVGVVRAVDEDLRALARDLRAEPASARGIALTEELVTWGGSKLHGHELAPLREELRRARYLLEQPS
jgi:hypothetical protein